MSAADIASLRLGVLMRASIEGHNEPACFRSIESTTPMNAGGGVALVAYRSPDDDKLAKLFAASPDLLMALQLLLSYTLACEAVLNAKPAGQIDIARNAIAKAIGP